MWPKEAVLAVHNGIGRPGYAVGHNLPVCHLPFHSGFAVDGGGDSGRYFYSIFP